MIHSQPLGSAITSMSVSPCHVVFAYLHYVKIDSRLSVKLAHKTYLESKI